MYWHHDDIQIAVFCDVIPHAVADTYTFQGNPLLPHAGSLTQTTPCGTTSCWWGRWGVVESNKDISQLYRTFTTTFTGCRLTETIYLTTFFLILKVG
jgi:hypothetical protein